jgi:hypothetical protein
MVKQQAYNPRNPGNLFPSGFCSAAAGHMYFCRVSFGPKRNPDNARRCVMFRTVVTRFGCAFLLLVPSARGVDKDMKNPDNLVPRAPLAALASHPIRLLASDFSTTGFELDATDPTTTETLQTPALASVSLPANPSRTSLLLCVSGPHSYVQIPSSAPLIFNGSYRITFKSSVLPGDFSFGFGFDGQREFAPSAQRIRRNFDPAGCGAVDEKLLTPFLSDEFGLPADQAQMLARDLLASQVTIEESVRITIQSVSFFIISNAALQIFGD